MLKSIFRKLRARLIIKRGWVSFFGVKMHFPANGTYAANVLISGAEYERDIRLILMASCKEESTVFDVGANIGVSAIPILVGSRSVKVVSFEASPTVLSLLQNTCRHSGFADRWSIVGKAVSSKANEEVEFHVSPPGDDALDGFLHTNRGGRGSIVKVSTTTLDETWRELGCPVVPIVKIDVEGSETRVLDGARLLISQQKPIIVLEWQLQNLSAYSIDPNWILRYAKEYGYKICLLPDAIPVSEDCFCSQLAIRENLLLCPIK